MSKRESSFFAFLARMKYINRWGLMRNTQAENLQEHSLQVAMIAHALAIIKNTYFNGNINAEKVAVLAIFHDSNETITGDMPTPIKYFNPEISTAYKDIENISKDKLISMLPVEMQDKYKKILYHDNNKNMWKIVKAADRISAYTKCIEEKKAGNKEFKKAENSIYKTIKDLEMPEVDFFMKEFMPSFSLTLDELD